MCLLRACNDTKMLGKQKSNHKPQEILEHATQQAVLSMEKNPAIGVIYPRKLTCPQKGTISIGNTSSNHHFSGDMLVFRVVIYPTINKALCIPRAEFLP